MSIKHYNFAAIKRLERRSPGPQPIFAMPGPRRLARILR